MATGSTRGMPVEAERHAPPAGARPDLTSPRRLTRGGIGTEPRPRLGVHSAVLTRWGDGRSALMTPGCATSRLCHCTIVLYTCAVRGID